jgi:hypothetical protein
MCVASATPKRARIGAEQRYGFGLADGEGLGNLLADDDVQRREDEKADQERSGVQHRRRQPCGLEDRLEERSDRRLADPAKTQRRHGDAKLTGRQIGFEILHDLLREAGAAVATLCQGVNTESACLHQGELCRDEERIGRQQQHHRDETDSCAAHISVPPAAWAALHQRHG